VTIAPWYPVLAAGIPAAAGGLAWGACHPASPLFGPVLRRLPSNQAIALTFDDGPNPAVTPRLLELLDTHGARATFFLIGQFARACPGIVREIADRGHTIGNHTETHPSLVFLSSRRVVAELAGCQRSIAAITGTAPSLMRPPFGRRGPQLRAALETCGLKQVVTWTLLGHDWSPRGKQRLIPRLGRVHGGDIVVFHDGSHRMLNADRMETLRALEHWLPRWKDSGLRTVSLD
jgi:peptidoglycan/xylan/chitin deacetylase (PgdA/CDA1 family)